MLLALDWNALASIAVFASIVGAAVWRGGVRLDRKLDQHLIETVRPTVREEIIAALVPVNESLSHLHDCIERVGAEAIDRGEEAATEARAAKEAAELLRTEVGQLQWREKKPMAEEA